MDIYLFYGKDKHYIQVLTENGFTWLDGNNPTVVINNNPFRR